MRSRTYTITSWWAQTTSQISIPLKYYRRNHHPKSKQTPSTKTPTSTQQLMLQFLPVFLLITFEPHGSHRSHAQRPHRWHHWNIGLPGVHRRHWHQSPGRGRHGSARGQGALRSRALWCPRQRPWQLLPGQHWNRPKPTANRIKYDKIHNWC